MPPLGTPALHRIGQLVALPLQTGQVAVGLVVAREDLLGGVPLELAADPAGDVGQVADGAGPVADLHVGNRLLSRLDAVDRVLEMVVALVEANVFFRWRCLGK